MLSLNQQKSFKKPEILIGSPNIVYISLPDTNSNCSSWLSQLPSLPSGWQYRCSATPEDITGNGWIPFDFSPYANVSKLPVDPINKPPYYYSYVTGGSFKLSAKPEINYNFAISDGGIDPILYEVGDNLKLSTFQSGLVLYLPFDEGQGTTAYDYSGYGNNGTIYSSITPSATWVDGKVGGALSFDGVDDYVKAPYNSSSPLFNLDTKLTYELWVNPNSTGPLIERQQCSNAWPSAELSLMGGAPNFDLSFKLNYQNDNTYTTFTASQVVPQNQWSHIVATYDKAASTVKLYVNGSVVFSGTYSQTIWKPTTPLWIGGIPKPTAWCWEAYFKGLIDEVRIYNRALSAEEIQALYEATK